MKIVQINAVYEYSSTGRQVKEMHEFLLKEGIDSYVAAVNIPMTSGRLIKVGSRIGMVLHAVLSRLIGLQGYFSIYDTRKLIKRIDEINPDVVHLHNLHSNFINLPLLLGYLGTKNIATVITVHDFWFMTGHCCYFTDTECEKWKFGCGNCPDIKNWNSSWFFDTSRKCIRDKERWFSAIPRLALIGVSGWVTGFFNDSILKGAIIKRTIYNWVDTDMFAPRNTTSLREKLGIKKTDFVVLGVAQNWTRTKGFDDFVDIANMEPDFKIVMVGTVLDKSKVLPKNVICVGVAKSTEELISYYSMADVFFNPTLRETFGKVTTEALACGTPVVAYDTTATSELIAPGCGFLVKPKDVNDTVHKIRQIREAGKDEYSDTCRNVAVMKFSHTALWRQYLNLYNDIVRV